MNFFTHNHQTYYLRQNVHVEAECFARSPTNISCLQMAVTQGDPHTIAILLKYGASMTGFISGESILDQLVIDGNIDALDFLFHEKNSNLWFHTKVILVFF